MKLVDVVAWTLNGIIFLLMIHSLMLKRKTKKLVNKFQEKDEIFVKEINKKYDDFVEQYNERATLLSKENNKLRSENEELKERLRDLGIKDFDVLN